MSPNRRQKDYRLSNMVLWAALAVFGSIFATQSAVAQSGLMTREFHAELSADQETRFTESPAKGTADIVVDLKTLEARWTITFQDLKSRPIAITLHGPAQPGANGVVMLDLAPKGKSSPLEGRAILNDAQVQFMLNRWAYVNVTTENYPKGEIRGQLTTVRPKPEG